MMDQQQAAIQMRETTDPDERDRAHRQREQFDKNSAWLQKNISSIYALYRGKSLCVSGQEAFVADHVKDAIKEARAAHPEDEGWFTRFIPKEKVVKVYAL